MRSALLQYTVSQSFPKDGPASETEAKQEMTETLRRNIDGRELKKAATALGFVSVGVCNKVVGFEQSKKHRWYAHKTAGLPEAMSLNKKVQWA